MLLLLLLLRKEMRKFVANYFHFLRAQSFWYASISSHSAVNRLLKLSALMPLN
jgi:hypothetical protein